MQGGTEDFEYRATWPGPPSMLRRSGRLNGKVIRSRKLTALATTFGLRQSNCELPLEQVPTFGEGLSDLLSPVPMDLLISDTLLQLYDHILDVTWIPLEDLREDSDCYTRKPIHELCVVEDSYLFQS